MEETEKMFPQSIPMFRSSNVCRRQGIYLSVRWLRYISSGFSSRLST